MPRMKYVIIYIEICAPVNVRITALTPRIAEVTWEPSSSPDVTGYLISYTTTASYTSGGSATVDGGSTTTYTFTDLEEDTYYTITVQATTSDNRMSTNSNAVSIMTDIDCK